MSRQSHFDAQPDRVDRAWRRSRRTVRRPSQLDRSARYDPRTPADARSLAVAFALAAAVPLALVAAAAPLRAALLLVAVAVSAFALRRVARRLAVGGPDSRTARLPGLGLSVEVTVSASDRR